MAKINTAALESLIQQLSGSSSGGAQAAVIAQQIETAANDLIQEFESSAAGSGVTADFGWGKGLAIISDNSASIDIYADNNTRPSLYPDDYPDGATDLVGLFDLGYNASNRVYGMWHGAPTRSRTSFSPTNFLESAVESFKASHDNIQVTLNR